MAKKVVYVKKKVDYPPQEEGLPGWMATFADMVTLLLCFFVLLLSFAKQDLDKFRDMLGSMENAFGVASPRVKSERMALETTSSRPDKSAPASQEEMMLAGVVVRIKTLLDKEDEQIRKHTGVSPEREGVLLRAESAYLFKPGTAELTPAAIEVLTDAIAVLKEYDLHLVVRAHTDDTQPPPGTYPSNWELSAARAAKVLAYINEVGGIKSKRLKAVGYAQTQPLAPNTTEENRLKNQRVELYFHKAKDVAW